MSPGEGTGGFPQAPRADPVGVRLAAEEPSSLFARPSCPRCRHSGFDTFSHTDQDITIFRCHSCGTSWRVAVGWVCEVLFDDLTATP
jgi:ribosomal protein S27E